MKNRHSSFAVVTTMLLLGWSAEGAFGMEPSRFHSLLDRSREARLANLHIPFVPNRGQTDPAVAFYAPTFAGTVYVARTGEIVYSLRGRQSSLLPRPHAAAARRMAEPGWSLIETPVGGRIRVKPEQPAVARVSYFIGKDPSRWRSGIPTYGIVELGEVWPGARLSLRAHGNNVEKIFTVAPEADPSRIRMRIAGARLRLNDAGELVASTGLGDVTFTRPEAYQEHDGVRREVEVAYRLRGGEYGFSVNGRNPSLPVVIDPLLQTTYLGGTDWDRPNAIAIDPTTGEVFVGGTTTSYDFPGTAGGAQPTNIGVCGVDCPIDPFVARFDATLTTLKQATYVGGSGADFLSGLAIHPLTGDVYIAGTTQSATFPGGTAYDLADFFIVRFNHDLTALKNALVFGGSTCTTGNGIVFSPTANWATSLAIHPTTGQVFVGGYTDSGNLPGGAQPTNAGGECKFDGFVARFEPDLAFSFNNMTYLGGSDDDRVNGLAINAAAGEILVVGNTKSVDFPATAGGAQGTNGGGTDVFVARLNTDLTTLHRATYLGGSGDEDSPALAIHPASGEVFVTGATSSTNLPGTAGGAQPAYGGGPNDSFVARLTPALTALNQATYLGGSGSEGGNGLVLDPTSGDVLVAGNTDSTNFPVTAVAAQPAIGGGTDAFVSRWNADLTVLKQATYLGGSGDDGGNALALSSSSGDILVAGDTTSTDFPATAGGAQSTNGGGDRDGFVARLTPDLTVFAGAPGTASCEGTTVSALSRRYGTLENAAAALGFPSVKALRDTIRSFCGD